MYKILNGIRGKLVKSNMKVCRYTFVNRNKYKFGTFYECIPHFSKVFLMSRD